MFSAAHTTPVTRAASGPRRRGPRVAAAKRAEAAVFASLGAVLRARGRDVTARARARSALVLAPHPDDETLGCGATIMRKVDAGRPVHVVIATDGRASHPSGRVTPDNLAAIRREEALRACGVLGVPESGVTFLGMRDGDLGRHTDAARARILELVRDLHPDEIYAPCGIDRHPDHRVLNAIAADLVREGSITCPVLEYPIWFWAARSWLPYGRTAAAGDLLRLPARLALAGFGLLPCLVRTAGYLDRKAQALSRHASQAYGLPGEPDSPRLDCGFVAHFFRSHELFFPLCPPQTSAPASPMGSPDA